MITPGQIDRALAAWDAYVMECNGRRASVSMALFGHTGASIPAESPNRRKAMQLALEAAQIELEAEVERLKASQAVVDAAADDWDKLIAEALHRLRAQRLITGLP